MEVRRFVSQAMVEIGSTAKRSGHSPRRDAVPSPMEFLAKVPMSR